jgi:hypothetical protein
MRVEENDILTKWLGGYLTRCILQSCGLWACSTLKRAGMSMA